MMQWFFSTLTRDCHYFQNIFIILTNLCIPHSLLPSAWEQLSVSMDMFILDISSKCNHAMRGLFKLASFTLHSVFRGHLFVVKPPLFLFMAEYESIVQIYHILFTHT